MRTLHGALALLGLLAVAATSRAVTPVGSGPIGFLTANDGMSCAGTLIQLGDRQERVIRLCGAPTSAGHWVLKWRGKRGVLDMWRYERYGSFPRMLRFENGVLVSLAAIGAS